MWREGKFSHGKASHRERHWKFSSSPNTPHDVTQSQDAKHSICISVWPEHYFTRKKGLKLLVPGWHSHISDPVAFSQAESFSLALSRNPSAPSAGARDPHTDVRRPQPSFRGKEIQLSALTEIDEKQGVCKTSYIWACQFSQALFYWKKWPAS